jgi:GNAT superfamily N-acetyltransferase
MTTRDDPTADGTAPESGVHRLADGTRVAVRPLRHADRDEFITRYAQLSERSRRLRFVSAPAQLSARMLDLLFDVDGVDRVALVATLVDEPGTPGVGIARFVRSRTDPTTADAAVTVVDPAQGRGIGTLLLACLVTEAMDRGIAVFTADVMWENSELLDGLRAVGARIVPGEPGLAAVLVDLPPDPALLRSSPVYEVLKLAGADAPGGA